MAQVVKKYQTQVLYYVASGDLSPWDWAVLRTQLFEELGVIGTAKARFLQVTMTPSTSPSTTGFQTLHVRLPQGTKPVFFIQD